MSDQQSTTERPRPRWARMLHNLGDDLRWALTGWCGFPRPVARVVCAFVAAVASWRLGLDGQLADIIGGLVGE